MSKPVVALFVALYLSAVFLATVFIVMAFVRGLKTRAGLPYRPLPIIFPPVPVEPTVAGSVVGWLGIIWSAAHLGVIGVWLATGYLVPRTAPPVIVGVYLSFAALLVGLGGAMLTRCRAMGRTLISWGMVLLALLTFYALIISFLLPSLESVPLAVRQMGRVIGTLVAIHLVFDTVVGAMAQKVGRPAGWAEREAEPAEQFPTPEPTADWEKLDQEH